MVYNIILNIEPDKLKMYLIYEGTRLSLRLLGLTHMNCSMSKLRKLCCTTIYACISISRNKWLCGKIILCYRKQKLKEKFYFLIYHYKPHKTDICVILCSLKCFIFYWVVVKYFLANNVWSLIRPRQCCCHILYPFLNGKEATFVYKSCVEALHYHHPRWHQEYANWSFTETINWDN